MYKWKGCRCWTSYERGLEIYCFFFPQYYCCNSPHRYISILFYSPLKPNSLVLLSVPVMFLFPHGLRLPVFSHQTGIVHFACIPVFIKCVLIVIQNPEINGFLNCKQCRLLMLNKNYILFAEVSVASSVFFFFLDQREAKRDGWSDNILLLLIGLLDVEGSVWCLDCLQRWCLGFLWGIVTKQCEGFKWWNHLKQPTAQTVAHKSGGEMKGRAERI